MISVAPIAPPLLIGEKRVVLRNITWDGYQQILQIAGDNRSARLSLYCNISSIYFSHAEPVSQRKKKSGQVFDRLKQEIGSPFKFHQGDSSDLVAKRISS